MDSYAAVIQALNEAAVGRADLRSSIRLYTDLLELESSVGQGLPAREVSGNQLDRCLQSGQPVLVACGWTVDCRTLAPLCVQLAYRTAQHRPELGKRLAAISNWIVSHGEELERLVVGYLQGGPWRDELDTHLDAELCNFIMAHALHPFLRAEAARLAPRLDLRSWFRGRCPVCGGEPDMAALDGDGARRLLCSRCDMEWPFYRTVCPFCADETSIGYFETRPGYRLYVCDTCRRYLKTVVLPQVATVRPLAAERILTADLDVAAQAASWGKQKPASQPLSEKQVVVQVG